MFEADRPNLKADLPSLKVPLPTLEAGNPNLEVNPFQFWKATSEICKRTFRI
jgi:hypothetical protein